ncbi:hypothetical protein AAE478_008800 [Parahypoxylon ruwenzoriense]
MTTGMILPKGIVFNRNTIYEEIAKYDIVPLEKIHAACHVFTTTSRELVDPTARRLENFWTRVLGGDRRYLPGRVIARLFRSISEEESFVRLRGPPNRYEPPSLDSQLELTGEVQANAVASEGGPSEPRLESTAKGTKTASSSSRKQPHPILKKPRGPSSSGPRPTARFVSPPGSDGENVDGKDGELVSSGSTAVNHSGDSKGSNSSTAKEEKKRATNSTPKKKSTAFVASTASRRRPAMPRRVSSQSSTAAGGSEAGSKEGSSSPGSRHSGSQSSVLTIPDKQAKGSPSTTKESNERLSAKAAGKRPAAQLSPDKHTAPKPKSSQASSSHSQPLPAQNKSPNAKLSESIADSKSKTTVEEAGRAKASQGKTAHRRSDTQERPRPDIAPQMSRSRSDISSSRRSSQELTRRAPPQSLISLSTATVSNATAQGTIIEFDENPSASEAVTSALREHDEETETSSRRSGSSILDTRFTPTQPSAAPSVPLGRSKSQLTLLLERKGEKKSRR